MKHLNIAIALVAGLAGGVLSQQLLSPVQAQNTAPLSISAQSFVLVDANGRVAGEFTVEGTVRPEQQNGNVRTIYPAPIIVLRDANGQRIWRANGGIQPLGVSN